MNTIIVAIQVILVIICIKTLREVYIALRSARARQVLGRAMDEKIEKEKEKRKQEREN